MSSLPELDLQERLFHAVVETSILECEGLLSRVNNVDIKNGSGRTLLHVAVRLGHFEWVHRLLIYGADPHVKDRNGATVYDVSEEMMEKYPDNEERKEIGILIYVVYEWKSSRERLRQEEGSGTAAQGVTLTWQGVESLRQLSSDLSTLSQTVRCFQESVRQELNELSLRVNILWQRLGSVPSTARAMGANNAMGSLQIRDTSGNAEPLPSESRLGDREGGGIQSVISAGEQDSSRSSGETHRAETSCETTSANRSELPRLTLMCHGFFVSQNRRGVASGIIGEALNSSPQLGQSIGGENHQEAAPGIHSGSENLVRPFPVHCGSHHRSEMQTGVAEHTLMPLNSGSYESYNCQASASPPVVETPSHENTRATASDIGVELQNSLPSSNQARIGEDYLVMSFGNGSDLQIPAGAPTVSQRHRNTPEDDSCMPLDPELLFPWLNETPVDESREATSSGVSSSSPIVVGTSTLRNTQEVASFVPVDPQVSLPSLNGTPVNENSRVTSSGGSSASLSLVQAISQSPGSQSGEVMAQNALPPSSEYSGSQHGCEMASNFGVASEICLQVFAENGNGEEDASGTSLAPQLELTPCVASPGDRNHVERVSQSDLGLPSPRLNEGGNSGGTACLTKLATNGLAQSHTRSRVREETMAVGTVACPGTHESVPTSPDGPPTRGGRPYRKDAFGRVIGDRPEMRRVPGTVGDNQFTVLTEAITGIKTAVFSRDVLLEALETSVTSVAEEINLIKGQLLSIGLEVGGVGRNVEELKDSASNILRCVSEGNDRGVGISCVEAMMRRTDVINGDEEKVTQIRRYYENLAATSLLEPILSFLRSQALVRVLIDCNSKFIGGMKENYVDHDGVSRVGGCFFSFADFSERKVYLGGKVSSGHREEMVRGWLARTLAQMAVFLAFNNGGRPYAEGDARGRQQYRDIVQEALGKMGGELDTYINWSLEWDSFLMKEVKLISAVPLMIAQYGVMEATSILQEQLPGLLEFYKEHVLTTLRSAIEDNKFAC